ncbi:MULTISPECIES: HlyD family efflux transporter periplasmic adaptor subunit [Marinobacter]|jgi:adhesin transport system membrane fusion protein|uniref:Type I secretion system membrane fusion protein PrsE n=1 Tax=Marinobacter salarius TaxID=1420917 RepID=A0A1W6K6S7_9GAMM|nr:MULTISPECIES: HlyD family efflux transporter periplasmic adaptor subunit [Marinobacter]ARM83134.1 type I secretion system membrane fusion protein PrsE [Marinobacter salarius]MDM8181398.1 HlyD family efflux transporter periplasmic adaptor subunit [Marinobacter salarius]MDP4531669.1 HlyD family efflux transporter periplasmic adaptor subunit [Marinobacter salarius]VVT09383.1 Type I secretion system membrane fusion protein PrsE [Marinobacter salarius]VXB92079.1 Type I secretion system membrane |tara:strand:- start:458 stop:1648 length:1191 start_codon:yes stop_codon:yes gene_type:complete
MASRDTQTLRILNELGDTKVSRHYRASHPILWFSLLVIAVFIGWSAWAEVDEVTRGEGQVVPLSRMQTIQSLDGGILAELMVRRGDRVERGQLLVRLDDTQFRSAYLEIASQIAVLRASIARLKAEVLEKSDIDFPETLDPEGELVQSERALFHARRERMREAERSINKEMSLARRQLELVEPLVERRSVSEMESLKLGQTIAGLAGRLAELRNTYVQDAYTELSAKQAEVSSLEQKLMQRRDKLERTNIYSPVRGRVNDILINTEGGVIRPGEPIMEITPIEGQLLIEAKVRPQDVAFVAPGMPASVKITAYDYTIYGDLQGEVEQISEDTIEEETPRGKEAFYEVLIRTEKAYLERNGITLPIRPGMVAQVDIQTGKRTLLSYLLKPIIKARLY